MFLPCLNKVYVCEVCMYAFWNARYRVEINIEIILWPSSIKISSKKSGQSERSLANIKDFKGGDNLFA